MSTKGTEQSGFSAVLSIVAVVLVIGVLGFIGWRVYSQPSAKTNYATSNNQSTSKTPTNNTTTPPAQQVDPNVGYIVIKEWGVRFKPVSGLNGLEYVISNDGYSANFTTQQLAQADPACNGSDASGYPGLGKVSRIATSAEQPIASETLITTINGYNYYFTGGGAPCADSTTNATAANLLGTEKPELTDSLKSLEAAQ